MVVPDMSQNMKMCKVHSSLWTGLSTNRTPECVTTLQQLSLQDTIGLEKSTSLIFCEFGFLVNKPMLP